MTILNKFDVFPSLLSADFGHMAMAVQHWDRLDIKGFHLDVMDGHFVPNLTFGPDLVRALRPHTKKVFDVHLMVTNPDIFIEAFVAAGADRLSVHVELGDACYEVIKTIKSLGCQAGLAINPQTSIDTLQRFLDHLDFVLIMTVVPGFAGGEFVAAALEKIPKLLAQRHDLAITVDGAMGPDTVQQAVFSGANQIVSGSKLFQGGSQNYENNLRLLRQKALDLSD